MFHFKKKVFIFIKVFKSPFFCFKMGCFIKKIWENKGEENGEVHKQFVRFGKGSFNNRAVLNLQKSESSGKIKLRGGFEWANDFVIMTSELAEVNFSGLILSKEKIPELEKYSVKKKAGGFEYEIENLSSEKIKEIKDKVYCRLLDGEGDGISLKIKKKLPKPGKSGDSKGNDKFCSLEADLKYWPQIKDFFMLPDCKKCKIAHNFVIEEIILPEEAKAEKDFAKIREMAKRKGRIVRNLEVDKQEKKEEKEFVA